MVKTLEITGLSEGEESVVDGAMASSLRMSGAEGFHWEATDCVEW